MQYIQKMFLNITNNDNIVNFFFSNIKLYLNSKINYRVSNYTITITLYHFVLITNRIKLPSYKNLEVK